MTSFIGLTTVAELNAIRTGKGAFTSRLCQRKIDHAEMRRRYGAERPKALAGERILSTIAADGQQTNDINLYQQ
jgi:hypothetical protein